MKLTCFIQGFWLNMDLTDVKNKNQVDCSPHGAQVFHIRPFHVPNVLSRRTINVGRKLNFSVILWTNRKSNSRVRAMNKRLLML